MDGCGNTMLQQILSDCPTLFQKLKCNLLDIEELVVRMEGELYIYYIIQED